MIKQLSIKTKIDWMSALENNGKICSIKFKKLKKQKTCHRVIKTGDGLGGFTSVGGIILKKNY